MHGPDPWWLALGALVLFLSKTLYVHVRDPGDLPLVEDLMCDLEGRVPDGTPIVVDTTTGRRIAAGKVGG